MRLAAIVLMNLAAIGAFSTNVPGPNSGILLSAHLHVKVSATNLVAGNEYSVFRTDRFGSNAVWRLAGTFIATNTCVIWEDPTPAGAILGSYTIWESGVLFEYGVSTNIWPTPGLAPILSPLARDLEVSDLKQNNLNFPAQSHAQGLVFTGWPQTTTDLTSKNISYSVKALGSSDFSITRVTLGDYTAGGSQPGPSKFTVYAMADDESRMTPLAVIQMVAGSSVDLDLSPFAKIGVSRAKRFTMTIVGESSGTGDGAVAGLRGANVVVYGHAQTGE